MNPYPGPSVKTSYERIKNKMTVRSDIRWKGNGEPSVDSRCRNPEIINAAAVNLSFSFRPQILDSKKLFGLLKKDSYDGNHEPNFPSCVRQRLKVRTSWRITIQWILSLSVAFMIVVGHR